ncbi:hypothetical protein V8G54_037317, partial [Vigna mungo]
EVKIHVLSCHDDDPSAANVKTLAGGSVANTVRGLRTGFGISSGIIGACGDDDQGEFFVHNMNFNGVDLSRLRKKKGHTAQWLMVRNFKQPLLKLLESGNIDLCFANEDEATELLR